MKNLDLVVRTYRVKKDHDKKIKKLSKKRNVSESEIVRSLIEKENVENNLHSK
jgi:hypothetical protein